MLKIIFKMGGWYVMSDGEIIAEISSNDFNLKQVKFRKGGRPLLHFHQLHFHMFSDSDWFWYVGDDYSVKVNNDGRNPEFILKARSEEFGAVAETKLIVSENADGGFVYRISQRLTLERGLGADTVFNEYNSFIGGNGERLRYYQYTDPFPMHVVGPPTDWEGYWPGYFYPGAGIERKDWRKHWQIFAYEREPGRFYTWKHHHEGPHERQKVVKGGIFAALDEPSGNLAYRYLSGDSHISICLWGYDVHMALADKAVLAPGASLFAEYEIFALSDEQTEHVKRNSIPIPIPDGVAESYASRPIVTEGVNRFDRAYSIDDNLSFAWTGYGTWDKTQGYDDSYSLKLTGDGEGSVKSWGAHFGQEMFMKPVFPGKKYRLSCMAKAKGVKGKGLKIGLCFGEQWVPGYNELNGQFNKMTGMYFSGSAAGDFDWQRIEIVTPPSPRGVVQAVVQLVLEGAGEAWFDNVLLEEA